jgi:hypothetical protein
MAQSFPETDANLTKDFIRVAGDGVGGVHHEGEFGVHEFHEKHGDVEIFVVDTAGFTRQPRTFCPFRRPYTANGVPESREVDGR